MTRNEIRTQIATAIASIIESEFVAKVETSETSDAITVTIRCTDETGLEICGMNETFAALPTTDFTHTEVEGATFVVTYLD